MNTRTVRELGGEIWAEITRHYLSCGRELKIEDLQIISDLTLGVLARHIGAQILNDADLPVAPLEKK